MPCYRVVDRFRACFRRLMSSVFLGMPHASVATEDGDRTAAFLDARLRSLLSVAPGAVLCLFDVLVGDVEVLGHLINRRGVDFLSLFDQLVTRRLIALNEFVE